jgi:hypothetical protein
VGNISAYFETVLSKCSAETPYPGQGFPQYCCFGIVVVTFVIEQVGSSAADASDLFGV